jgi:hypothetical protein
MQTVQGPVVVQTGKDLSAVSTVIGSGGPLAYGGTPASVLQAVIADASDASSLRPVEPRLFVDTNYLLYAAGLLAEIETEQAFSLAKRSLKQLNIENSHEIPLRTA